jgi:hypothetical protein
MAKGGSVIEVFSSGGGTQSAAIAALIVQGRLPKPDFVVIADTERERGTTWAYLDEVIRPALHSIGLEVHRVRFSEWGSMPAHGKPWKSHNGNTILLPAWTNQTGNIGKLDGFCSKPWKAEIVDRYLSRQFGITRGQRRKWIGYSLDEPKRFTRIMVSEEGQKGLIRLPLVRDVPTRRHQAIALVEALGWPKPPRSACYMCPNQGDDEWATITPEEMQAAIALEKELQADDPFIFLHSSCVPLDQIDFTREPDQPELALDGGRFCSSEGCFT